LVWEDKGYRILMDEIQKTIEQHINPLLKLHNGSAEAVSFEDGILSLAMNGGCAGCPSSKITLMNLIVPILEEKHSDILLEIILVV